jgi:hypothetical protein
MSCAFIAGKSTMTFNSHLWKSDLKGFLYHNVKRSRFS